MKCFECDETVEIKKYKAFKYDGVSLGNIVLLNVEVEVCSACDTETPLLRNIGKIHNAIGVGIALQMSHLSGADIKFLRRSSGFSVGDWAKRLDVAEGTYSKWENGQRDISAQADKLARINYINALKQKDPQNVRLAGYLDAILNTKIDSRNNGRLIAVDAENPEMEAKYLPLDTQLMAKPASALVRAATMRNEPTAIVTINRGRPTPKAPALAHFEAAIG